MSGIVRLEQKNTSLFEKDIFDDGPYEVGDENRLDADLVPVPANSYLGESIITFHSIQHSQHPKTDPGLLILRSSSDIMSH